MNRYNIIQYDCRCRDLPLLYKGYKPDWFYSTNKINIEKCFSLFEYYIINEPKYWGVHLDNKHIINVIYS